MGGVGEKTEITALTGSKEAEREGTEEQGGTTRAEKRGGR